MKLKFKRQTYQTNAVEAVADCFAGQPKREGLNYRMDNPATVHQITSDQVKYDVVDSYGTLMELVTGST